VHRRPHAEDADRLGDLAQREWGVRIAAGRPEFMTAGQRIMFPPSTPGDAAPSPRVPDSLLMIRWDSEKGDFRPASRLGGKPLTTP
jgi:hypothetical protein